MSEPREQFTFYRSFYDGIRELSKKDQSTIILAICAYAIYEEEPEKLSPAAATAFNLIRPVLNSARKKAASGKQGGSKPKAPSKQTVREKEKEKEREKEKENNSSKLEADAFEQLWADYPLLRKGDKVAAMVAYNAHVISQVDAAECLSALDDWKRSEQWAKDGGQYIPSLQHWLERELWTIKPPQKNTVPKGASGELGEAELEAIRQSLAWEPPENFDEMVRDMEASDAY